MTTTLDTSCSENTMVLSEGEGFCMHVFFSSKFKKSYPRTIAILLLKIEQNGRFLKY